MTRYTIIIDDYPTKELYERNNSIFAKTYNADVNTSSEVCIEVDTQLKEFIKQLERPNRTINPIELY